MHDYLARLIGRATATTEVVRPLSVPRFARAAERAPGDGLPVIDESEARPESGRGDAAGRASSQASDGESESMRVVARVASMDEGEAPRAPARRRSPERIRAADGLRPDGRPGVADASPEPLASPPPTAPEARVARSSDRLSRADDAEPATDPAERRRHVVTTRVVDRDEAAEGISERNAARAAGDIRRGQDAPADARDDSGRSSIGGRLERDAGASDDQRRAFTPIERRGSRDETSPEPSSSEPVRIAIGRIEVKIATREQPERASERAVATAPLVTLDDYLARQRRQGRAGR